MLGFGMLLQQLVVVSVIHLTPQAAYVIVYQSESQAALSRELLNQTLQRICN